MKKRRKNKSARRRANQRASARRIARDQDASHAAAGPAAREDAKQSPGTPTAGSSARWRWTKRVLAALALCAVGAAIAAAVLYHRSNQSPQWWAYASGPMPDGPARGERIEQLLTHALATATPSPNASHDADEIQSRATAPAELRIGYDDANAWLTHRLPLWLANQGIELPWKVHAVAVSPEPPVLNVGVAFAMQQHAAHDPKRNVVITFGVEPRIDADGSGTVHLRWARIGRLTLPIGALKLFVPAPPSPTENPDDATHTERLDEPARTDEQQVAAAVHAVLDGATLFERADFSIDGHTRVRITEVAIEADAIRVRFVRE